MEMGMAANTLTGMMAVWISFLHSALCFFLITDGMAPHDGLVTKITAKPVSYESFGSSFPIGIDIACRGRGLTIYSPKGPNVRSPFFQLIFSYRSYICFELLVRLPYT